MLETRVVEHCPMKLRFVMNSNVTLLYHHFNQNQSNGHKSSTFINYLIMSLRIMKFMDIYSIFVRASFLSIQRDHICVQFSFVRISE